MKIVGFTFLLLISIVAGDDNRQLRSRKLEDPYLDEEAEMYQDYVGDALDVDDDNYDDDLFVRDSGDDDYGEEGDEAYGLDDYDDDEALFEEQFLDDYYEEELDDDFVEEEEENL